MTKVVWSAKVRAWTSPLTFSPRIAEGRACSGERGKSFASRVEDSYKVVINGKHAGDIRKSPSKAFPKKQAWWTFGLGEPKEFQTLKEAKAHVKGLDLGAASDDGEALDTATNILRPTKEGSRLRLSESITVTVWADSDGGFSWNIGAYGQIIAEGYGKTKGSAQGAINWNLRFHRLKISLRP